VTIVTVKLPPLCGCTPSLKKLVEDIYFGSKYDFSIDSLAFVFQQPPNC